MSVPRRQPVYSADDAAGRDGAGRFPGRPPGPRARGISPGAALPPSSAARRVPQSSGAGSGTRPPPSGTKAPRDGEDPEKHTHQGGRTGNGAFPSLPAGGG